MRYSWIRFRMVSATKFFAKGKSGFESACAFNLTICASPATSTTTPFAAVAKLASEAARAVISFAVPTIRAESHTIRLVGEPLMTGAPVAGVRFKSVTPLPRFCRIATVRVNGSSDEYTAFWPRTRM